MQKTRATKTVLRKDIQGLRAVAVAAVVLDHLLHWPSGGFVGVDIFFVISGFLITGLLIREWRRAGRISFVDFYRRRVKRILPASLLVIAVTVIAARFLFAAQRWHATVWDAVFSALFSANWRFMVIGSDYFQADGPVSPLRHYWSLAVEEQYYFIWPWVMLAVLLLTRKLSAKATTSMKPVVLTIIGITVASFAWALFATSTNPGAAYYDTFSRVWELGIGAILAFAVPWLEKLPHRLRPAAANLGLLGIVASVFLVSPDSGFPAPDGLIPVLATALVIAAGCGGEQKFLKPLTNRVSQHLGDISFSLYLWHFPVVIFLGAFLEADLFYYVLAGLLMLVLAHYSFRLVEDPIRNSRWLSKAEKRPHTERRRSTRTFVRSALGLAMCLTVLVGATGARLAIFPMASPSGGSTIESSSAGKGFPVDGPESRKIQAELQAAVGATEWPTFSPSLEEIIAKDPYPDGVHVCGDAGEHPADQCTWGPKDAKKHAVLVGDSISMRWATPLIKLYSENGWNIRVLGRYGCPFNLYPIAKPAEEGKACDDRKAEAVRVIQEMSPDIVFIGNTHFPERMSTTGKVATAEDWGAGMTAILSKIPNAKKKVLLSPPPIDKDPRQCYSPVQGPQACLGGVSQLWVDISAADRKSVEAVPGGVYVDTRQLYCTQDGMCPEFVGNIPIKQDGTHMTMYYGYHIQPALKEMLAKRGLG
jgi:peptidoglycan/LPS O-acetylase OafA/YrhL